HLGERQIAVDLQDDRLPLLGREQVEGPGERFELLGGYSGVRALDLEARIVAALHLDLSEPVPHEVSDRREEKASQGFSACRRFERKNLEKRLLKEILRKRRVPRHREGVEE